MPTEASGHRPGGCSKLLPAARLQPPADQYQARLGSSMARCELPREPRIFRGDVYISRHCARQPPHGAALEILDLLLPSNYPSCPSKSSLFLNQSRQNVSTHRQSHLAQNKRRSYFHSPKLGSKLGPSQPMIYNASMSQIIRA